MYYTFVHKLHTHSQMRTKEDLKILREKISGYNLFETLSDHLKIIIKKSLRNPEGGVGDTTIYKALREGDKTPTLKTILDTADIIVEKHEELIEEYMKDTQAAA